jgi:polyphosphate glucokinase
MHFEAERIRTPDEHTAHESHTSGAADEPRPAAAVPRRILVVDIGGTNLKLLASGESEVRKVPSGTTLTPARMVERVKKLSSDWRYDAVTIGFPGMVGQAGPACEPGNLGKGWVGFDFAAALGCPVKIANDAAMQALGSYDGGRMLFMGLGTGVGGALIAEKIILPIELGDLPWRRDRETLGDVLSARGMLRVGRRAWREAVDTVATRLIKSFRADYLVIGGGNAKKVKVLPHGVRLGHNRAAFRGGLRLWSVDDLPVLTDDHSAAESPPPPVDWRML